MAVYDGGGDSLHRNRNLKKYGCSVEVQKVEKVRVVAVTERMW